MKESLKKSELNVTEQQLREELRKSYTYAPAEPGDREDSLDKTIYHYTFDELEKRVHERVLMLFPITGKSYRDGIRCYNHHLRELRHQLRDLYEMQMTESVTKKPGLEEHWTYFKGMHRLEESAERSSG